MMERILDWVIPAANADTYGSPAGPQGGGLSFVVMLVVFFVFIYFFVWRPQNKRAKELQSLIDGLAVGDEVMTAGGIIGRVAKINDQYIKLATSDSTEIALQKSAVSTILPKGTLKSIN